MCVGGPGQLEFQFGRVVTQGCSFIATPLLRRHTQQNPPFGPTAQNLFARGALSSLCHGMPAKLPGLGAERAERGPDAEHAERGPDRAPTLPKQRETEPTEPGTTLALASSRTAAACFSMVSPHFVEEQHGVVQRGQTQGFYPLAELGLVLLELHQRRRVRSNDEALFKQFKNGSWRVGN